MKTPLQHFSTRRLAAWQGEWEFLQRSLVQEPDAVQAWWWKIRLRVLEFVIARYGADPEVRARDDAPAPLAHDDDFTFAERRTVEPRPRAALGAHLQSIAVANDFPRPPVPPDDDQPPARSDVEQWSWRLGMQFLFGGMLGACVSAEWVISYGLDNAVIVVPFAATFWLGCGTLAVILYGPLSTLAGRLSAVVARWLTWK